MSCRSMSAEFSKFTTIEAKLRASWIQSRKVNCKHVEDDDFLGRTSLGPPSWRVTARVKYTCPVSDRRNRASENRTFIA